MYKKEDSQIFSRIITMVNHVQILCERCCLMQVNQGNTVPDLQSRAFDMEKLINKVFGVISCKISFNAQGELNEIHILANTSRNAKQMVRDIQSSVAAVFGFVPDHRVISVAQIEDGLSPVGGIRLQLGNIQMLTEGKKMTVNVQIHHNGQEYAGTATGVNSLSGNPRTVVQAILGAVEAFLGREGYFTLADIQKIRIANHEAYIVAISFLAPIGEELLTGTSLIRQDEYNAIIKATLDAINRRITQIYHTL